jgi:Regulator of chromosome condensation (RCC1) repeat
MGARRVGPRRCERRGWVLGAAVLGGALSCIEPRAFPCGVSDECVLEGVQGRCEAEGWCSYPDEGCDGGSRFEALAPAGLGGQCVAAAGSSTGPDGATTEVESTGPGPVYSCDERPCTTKGIVVGDDHGCVRDGLDALWCWGDNTLGQLGRGNTSPAERCPGPTVDLRAVVRASASQHMCALDAGGVLSCWGNNDSGQVDWSDGAEAIVRTPAPLDPASILVAPNVIDVGPDLSCAASGSSVSCWGVIGAPEVLSTTAAVEVLAAGAQHACAVVAGGAVQCTGVDVSGQLGDGTPARTGEIETSQPIAEGASLVDAGYFHTCAVVTTTLEPEVQCWGANESGQGGAPADQEILSTPTRVPNLVGGPYQALALGARHSCVLAEDGRVQCWGDNALGQVDPAAPLGFGAHTVVLEEGAEPLRAIEIGAGRAHTCARTADDGVVCWGDNGALQLGAPSSEASRAFHWLELGCE